MEKTNLWWASQYPVRTIECELRALRLWDYLEQVFPPVMYKDIRKDMGLTYEQTVRAVGLLVNAGVVRVSVTDRWNGCYYVHEHRVWLKDTPVLVIRG